VSRTAAEEIRNSKFKIRISRPGFTLIEFLVAIGIFAILVAIILPYMMMVREDARRTECAAHLGQIGEALQRYARDNGATFPLPQTRYDPIHKPTGYVAFTGADDPKAVQANDITASIWLLVREGYVKDPATFICPSTHDRPDRLTNFAGNPTPALKRGNFRSPRNLSYSYASPFTNAFNVTFSTDQLPSEYAVMADKNPGYACDGDRVLGPPRDAPPFELAKGNSLNHQRAGQNVLHPGGDVSFESTPYCGVSNDNIYTAIAPHRLAAAHPPLDVPGYIGTDLGPAYNYDSYLVPTARDGN
jgi:prepilin-type N-terminal cleavage/methylation domain-containing protein